MTTIVRDNAEQGRYEVWVDDERAGFTDYRLSGERIAFTHTEVADAFGGRGLARKLVADALSDARRRGLGVLPFCPYVRKVIAENTDKYLDLVPVEDRARFQLPTADSEATT